MKDCFYTKDMIIDTAIESLRTEGLKFSVDTVAAKLKISKKTIYKFFPDKESLAYAIYERYYDRASAAADEICRSEDEAGITLRLLEIYRDASFMIRSEVFNKYKLNDCVYSYVIKLQNELWTKTVSKLAPSASPTDQAVLKAIIEGAFEKSLTYSAPPKLVTERLVKIL